MPQYQRRWLSTDRTTSGTNDGVITADGTQGFFPEFLDPLFSDWLGDMCNVQLGAIINGGSGYTEGVYENVDVRRNDAPNEYYGGRDLQVTITVDATGAVTSAVKTKEGSGYKAGDELVIVDNAQVGGTGAGFRIGVDDADHSIGLIYNSQQANSKSSTCGYLLGTHRDDLYRYGIWAYSSNPRSTSYPYLRNYSWYNGNGPSNSNNYYGNFSTGGSAYDFHYWYGTDLDQSTGDPWVEKFIWRNDPGNKYFVWQSQVNGYTQGYLKLNRDPAGNYPTTEVGISEWVYFYAGSFNSSISYMPVSADFSSSGIFDCTSRGNSYPTGPRGFFFRENNWRSDLFWIGRTPPDLHFCEPGVNQMAFDGSFSDGVDTRLLNWGNMLYIEEHL